MKPSATYVLAVIGIVGLVLAVGDARAVPTGAAGIELETDKTIYQPGEEVDFLYRVANNSDCRCHWDLRKLPGFDAWVFENSANLERNELLIYHEPIWSYMIGFIETSHRWIFDPGEMVEFDWTWDLTDYQGNPVGPGEYELLAFYYGTFESDCDAPLDLSGAQLHITVIPEPSILALLAASGVLLTKRRLMGARGLTA